MHIGQRFRACVIFVLAASMLACSESPEARQIREQQTSVEVRQLLAEQKFKEAENRLYGLTDSPEISALRKQATDGIMAAEKERAAREAASQAQSVKNELDGLAGDRVTTMGGVHATLAVFERAEGYLRQTEDAALDDAAKNARKEIRQALVSKQTSLFPRMRSTYAEDLGNTLWENDVEVIVSGSGNRRIRFVAGMFAANRNIAAAQQAASPMLRKLRFSRSQFEWYRGSEYTFYDMEPEPDSHVSEG